MRNLALLVCAALLISGCATNLTTRTEAGGTKTTQRTLTTWGMGNHSGNETVIEGDNLQMRSGVEHEGKLTPEEAALIMNILSKALTPTP